MSALMETGCGTRFLCKYGETQWHTNCRNGELYDDQGQREGRSCPKCGVTKPSSARQTPSPQKPQLSLVK